SPVPQKPLNVFWNLLNTTSPPSMSFCQPQLGLPLASTTGCQVLGVPVCFCHISELNAIEKVKSVPRPGTETIGIEKLSFRFCRLTVSNPADWNEPNGGRPVCATAGRATKARRRQASVFIAISSIHRKIGVGQASVKNHVRDGDCRPGRAVHGFRNQEWKLDAVNAGVIREDDIERHAARSSLREVIAVRNAERQA